ncbi:hypothetical protein D3C73_1547360 [compost metagenome]
MSQQNRSTAEAQARRTARTIAWNMAYLSKDATPIALAELHGQLGRAIAEIATTQKKES